MSNGTVAQLVTHIENKCAMVNYDIRTGQALFNSLPPGAANALAGTVIDPFHKDLRTTELYEWIDKHLIFSDMGNVIAVINNNRFVWEVPNNVS